MFECHVTIAPVFGADRAAAEGIAASCEFKLANLLMRKEEGPGEASRDDTFMTGHHREFIEIDRRMRHLVGTLRAFGFEVRRCKIEYIMFDTKYGDRMP